MVSSFGIPWYEAQCDSPIAYPPLDGEITCDVLIIGGGLTGVSAAYHLSKANISTVLIEEHHLGYGASGRNGGQLGTGQRVWAEEIEKKYGFEKAKHLFQLAETAKKHIFSFIKEHKLAVDYQAGHLSVIHHPRLEKSYRAHVEAMKRFDYNGLRYVEKDEVATYLGSSRYYGGVYDEQTGHLNPLKLLLGTAKLAQKQHVQFYEKTRADRIEKKFGRYLVYTAQGVIKAQHILIATNGYSQHFSQQISAHVMSIRSYVAATVPLKDHEEILPGYESVDDSRFVVRYFRKTKEGVLLFGGREAYTNKDPSDLFADMQKRICEVYPQLKSIALTHAWGGNIALTMPRLPYVQELLPNVTFIGGYSGHGVMLSHFFGRLYAEKLTVSDKRLHLIEELKIPSFPGWGYLQDPLLFLAMSWYSMLDHI